MLRVMIPRHEQSSCHPQWPGAQAPGRPAMVGTPPRVGRRAVRPGQDPCRGRRPAGRVGADRQPLACALACWRCGGNAHRPPRQAATPGPRRAGPHPPGAGPRAGGGRVRQRPVDAGARRRGDRADTGVAHHPGHVWRIVKQMRWSLQRPARKAVERDEAEIARWVAQKWPRIAQTPERAEPGSASSTSRGSS